MPSGGDGYYYFSAFLILLYSENGLFDIEINGDLICTVFEDQDQSSNDFGSASCSGMAYAAEGKVFFKELVNFLLISV